MGRECVAAAENIVVRSSVAEADLSVPWRVRSGGCCGAGPVVGYGAAYPNSGCGRSDGLQGIQRSAVAEGCLHCQWQVMH
jgi:hypothetical protein